AGLREVIIPKANEKDLRDIPPEVREKMHFTFASSMDEVFLLALLPQPTPNAVDLPPAEPEHVGPADVQSPGSRRRTPLIPSKSAS
ncbi:MAG: S16 family serine protease, partial [Gemmatimonadaceae bacterium]